MNKANTVFIIYYEWSTDGEYFNEIFVYKDYENALDKYEHWKDDDRKYAEETGLACDETVNKDEMKHNWTSYKEDCYAEDHATISLEPYEVL